MGTSLAQLAPYIIDLELATPPRRLRPSHKGKLIQSKERDDTRPRQV
jgi:hypothetical protein